MRRERDGHAPGATAVVNEAYFKLVDQSRIDWQGKTHFLAIASSAMRRLLVDHARAKLRDKRGASSIGRPRGSACHRRSGRRRDCRRARSARTAGDPRRAAGARRGDALLRRTQR
ncbi:MAG: hypothetical protein IPF82_04390 [Blastocatellia bacterium]|nr:hypothetical protein [Blastocatellia bacterium]